MAAGIEFYDEPPKKKKKQEIEFFDEPPEFFDEPPKQTKSSEPFEPSSDYLGKDFADQLHFGGLRGAGVESAKALTRGIGTTIADVAGESRQSLAAREGSLPNILASLHGREPIIKENYEWADKLRENLPERSEYGLFRGVERFGKIASRPESLVFGPLGIVGAALPAVSGQTAEELGFGETGQGIAEALSIFGPAGYHGTKQIQSRKAPTTPSKINTVETPKETVIPQEKNTVPSAEFTDKPPVKKVPPLDTRGKGVQYHGTPKEINGLDSGYFNEQNIYGQGFYTTDAFDIASGYARRKTKGEKSPTVYKVTEKKPVKFYEMDKTIDPAIRDKISKLEYSEAPDYLSEGQTLTDLFDEMRESDRPAYEIQEDFDIIQGILRDEGYGGMKHKGGKFTNKQPHDVKIYFDPENQVSINRIAGESKTTKIDASKKPLTITKKPTPEIPEPIVESTGKGASEKIQYNPTRTEKITEAVNSTITAAKTPVQTFKKTTEALNTAVFNYLAPLEKLDATMPVASRPSIRIKLTQSVASEINHTLENGIYSNITGRIENGGLKDAYGDLAWKDVSRDLKPEEYSVKELDAYRADKMALIRQSQGKKTGVDTAKAQENVAKRADKYEPISEAIREYGRNIVREHAKDTLGSKGVESFNKGYHTSLYRMMDSGTNPMLETNSMTPKKWWQPFKGSTRDFIPPSESDIYNTSMFIMNRRKNDAVLSYLEGVQKGELPGKIRNAKQLEVPEHVQTDLGIESGDKIAQNVYNQTRKDGYFPEQNTLRCWKDGKAIDIEVPPEVYDVYKSSVNPDMGSIAKLFSTVNRVFSRAVTGHPFKALSIIARDQLSALVYSRTGNNASNVIESLFDMYGNKEMYRQWKANGGDTYANRLATRTARSRKLNDLITPGREGPIVPLEKAVSYFKKIPKFFDNLSMAVPYSEYKAAIKKFGDTPEGRIAAAMEAKKVTYDPNRKGASKTIRGIGNFIPFWNVALQDLPMLARNLATKEGIVKGISTISAFTLALKMYNDGNPDYDDLTPEDKAAYWHFFSGDNHVRMPIPWLLGTTFKVGAEALYDTVVAGVNNDEYRAKEAWEGLYKSFISNIGGAMNPILTAYIEQTTGKTPASSVGGLFGFSSDKAPPVVPKRLERLPPELQYTSKTSLLSKKFGELWGVSPVKMDKLIKNFGGTVAADGLALIDETAYWTGLAEDKRPERREKNYLLLGKLIQDSTPTYTKYQKEFYENLSEWTEQKAAQKIVPGYGDEKLASVNLGAYNRQVSALYKQYRQIEESDIPGNEKTYQLKLKQKEINAIYKEAVQAVRKAKKSK